MTHTIEIRDDQGKPVATVAAAAPESNALPKNLEWYKESITWFVTLAVGAGAVGIGFFDKGPVSHAAQTAFLIAGSLLSVAVMTGLWSHLKVLQYANEREGAELTKNIEAMFASFVKWWTVTLGFFFAGIIAFIVVALIKVGTAESEEPSYTLTAAGQAAVLRDEKTGNAWLIQSDRTGALRAVPLPRTVSGPPSSAAPQAPAAPHP